MTTDPNTTHGDYLCVSCVEWSDNTVSAQVLHCGDKESCEQTCDLFDGISVSPQENRTPVQSWMSVIKKADWNHFLEESRA